MHYATLCPYDPIIESLRGVATRQTEVDNLLRGKAMVDLLLLFARGPGQASDLFDQDSWRPFYAFTRAMPLQESNVALAAIQAGLDLATPSHRGGGTKNQLLPRTIRTTAIPLQSCGKLAFWSSCARRRLRMVCP